MVERRGKKEGNEREGREKVGGKRGKVAKKMQDVNGTN